MLVERFRVQFQHFPGSSKEIRNVGRDSQSSARNSNPDASEQERRMLLGGHVAPPPKTYTHRRARTLARMRTQSYKSRMIATQYYR
jgi:hypothetical protein